MKTSLKPLLFSLLSVLPLSSGAQQHAGHHAHAQGPAGASREGHAGHPHPGSEGHGAGGHGAHASARPAYRATLTPTPSRLQAGEVVTLTFSVRNAEGAVVRDLPRVHEKPMHLHIVPRDLSELAHVHPELQPDGTYQVRHAFPAGGPYTLYVDYTPRGSPQVVDTMDLEVSGPAREKVPLAGDLATTKEVGGLRVSLEADAPLRAGGEAVLRFRVADERTGTPVTDLQPYLGALAHFAILSEDTRDFLHAHPMEGPAPGRGASPSEVSAHTTFPRAGLYRVWAQLQRGGKVVTVPFVVRVSGA